MNQRPPFDLAVEMLLGADGAIALQHNPTNHTVDMVVHDGNAQCFTLRMTPPEVEALMLGLQVELSALKGKPRIV